MNERATRSSAEDDDGNDDEDKPLFGYRDLTKTKARLMKGDEMLDRSFVNFGYHLLDDPLNVRTRSVRSIGKELIESYASKICPTRLGTERVPEIDPACF